MLGTNADGLQRVNVFLYPIEGCSHVKQTSTLQEEADECFAERVIMLGCLER